MATLPKGTEKDRFLYVLGQALYELQDGVNIPGVRERTFNTTEYDYINGVCKYIERMIEFYDKKGLLVKEEYEAKNE